MGREFVLNTKRLQHVCVSLLLSSAHSLSGRKQGVCEKILIKSYTKAVTSEATIMYNTTPSTNMSVKCNFSTLNVSAANVWKTVLLSFCHFFVSKRLWTIVWSWVTAKAERSKKVTVVRIVSSHYRTIWVWHHSVIDKMCHSRGVLKHFTTLIPLDIYPKLFPQIKHNSIPSVLHLEDLKLIIVKKKKKLCLIICL